MRKSLAQQFLWELQQRIDRYQPMLENQFDVVIGKTQAREWRIGPWLNSAAKKLHRMKHAESMAKHGRPPSALSRLLLSAELKIIRAPMGIYLYSRHYFKGFVMRWERAAPAVLVSFAGWRTKDYEKNLSKLDQWSVHELAHGIWACIAQDGDSEHDHRWRLWNEGFAHYIADVHMRHTYPPSATVDEDWSPFRQRGKALVGDVVQRDGSDMLRFIPRNWAELDSESLKVADPRLKNPESADGPDKSQF